MAVMYTVTRRSRSSNHSAVQHKDHHMGMTDTVKAIVPPCIIVGNYLGIYIYICGIQWAVLTD